MPFALVVDCACCHECLELIRGSLNQGIRRQGHTRTLHSRDGATLAAWCLSMSRFVPGIHDRFRLSPVTQFHVALKATLFGNETGLLGDHILSLFLRDNRCFLALYCRPGCSGLRCCGLLRCCCLFRMQLLMCHCFSPGLQGMVRNLAALIVPAGTRAGHAFIRRSIPGENTRHSGVTVECRSSWLHQVLHLLLVTIASVIFLWQSAQRPGLLPGGPGHGRNTGCAPPGLFRLLLQFA